MFTFIGTRFSNLYTAFPDETEIKELKFKIWENYIQYFQTLKYGFCLLSRLKGCQLLTLLTVLYPQLDNLLDLYFLTCHLEFFLHTIVAKYCFTPLPKRTLLFLTAILVVYCFVPKGTNYSHVLPWWNCLLGEKK